MHIISKSRPKRTTGARVVQDLNPLGDRTVPEEPKNPVDSKVSERDSCVFAYHMSSMFYMTNKSDGPTLWSVAQRILA